MKLLVASRNAKKLAELKRVLAAADLASIEVVGLDAVEDFPETPKPGRHLRRILSLKPGTVLLIPVG